MKTAHDLVTAAKARIHEVDVENAEAAIHDADVLIDVREADEFHAGHIPGAINIPRGLLEFKLSNDPGLSARDRKLVLYCKNSGRSALSACSLQEMGYLQVLSIEGGFEAWSAAGKAVASPQLPAFD
ncbi:MAG TPA: rhodanese-like domain-containing protein [Pseudomonas sp.]|uniref:rhodanese-like domain-containing protein n=1 Tax=Pseudomonas sp. TaxID=306 RepID=UPI002CD429B1|nr:rhodanese-like domain-containing protein [Pseudomonas sp.]HSX86778.1 rhodanese-like domain-containing protein [Pseudomonas sp.]